MPFSLPFGSTVYAPSTTCKQTNKNARQKNKEIDTQVSKQKNKWKHANKQTKRRKHAIKQTNKEAYIDKRHKCRFGWCL